MTLYLDNAASSHPKPEQVYRAADDALRNIGANPGRSGHKLAMKASQKIARTRSLLARFFEIKDPRRIVFTANATEAINLGLKGLLNPGDHVITSSMEHNSVVRPLRFLESQGIDLTFVPGTSLGQIEIQAIEKAIRKNTRLLVLTHASNVTGGIMPISEAAVLAHKYGFLLMVDAAQTAGLVPISVADMGIDLLAAPGHKGLLGSARHRVLIYRPGYFSSPFKGRGYGQSIGIGMPTGFFTRPDGVGHLEYPGSGRIRGWGGIFAPRGIGKNQGERNSLEQDDLGWTKRKSQNPVVRSRKGGRPHLDHFIYYRRTESLGHGVHPGHGL